MFDLDKSLVVVALKVNSEDNIEYIIFIVTNAYGISINNLDIMVVIQWNLPTNANIMIQRIGQVEKKG